MSLPEPFEWKNYNKRTGQGDPSTPMTAENKNLWWSQFRAKVLEFLGLAEAARDEAQVARDEAVAQVEFLAAPADEQVAGYVEGVGGLTRAALNASYARGISVKAYGAKGDGVTDDTAAINAAVAAAAAGYTQSIYFPNGTYLFSETITAKTILGENRQKTILKYTGAGSAVGPGVGIMYHRRMENLTLLGSDVGTGLDLNASPAGHYRNMIVQDFATGVSLDGDALYNVFEDVTFQSCATGVRIDGLSHENRFRACRVNFADTGFDVINAGRNVIEAAAIENCTVAGVRIRTAAANGTRANAIALTRFEFNTANVIVESTVEMTALIANRYIGGTLTDSGTYTMNVDITTGQYKGTSADLANVRTAAVFDRASFSNARAQFTASGTTIDRNIADSNPTLRVNNIHASATGNIAEFQAASTLFARFMRSGHLGIRTTTAPADSALNAGEVAFWFDSTSGAAKLMVKAKDAGGTVRTGSVNLT